MVNEFDCSSAIVGVGVGGVADMARAEAVMPGLKHKTNNCQQFTKNN
jgi:hypothetical protein